jgi:hypothetical protein
MIEQRAVAAGPWERRAVGAGVLVATVNGLTKPKLALRRDCPPIFFLPRWAVGVAREYVFAWLVLELLLRALGERGLMSWVNAYLKGAF